jgi:hypothetical protein
MRTLVQVRLVYTATASDTDFNGLEDITFSLADENIGFSIDADTGVVTTNADFAANYENAQSQSFTVVAADATGNASAQQLVSVAINNLDEIAPSITSAVTAAAIDENSGAGQVIYTATADDSLDISAGVTFSLTGDSDPALSIDSLTGAVTLNADADYETQSQYSFAVIATDAAANVSEAQSVTLDINNLDEVAPTITSDASNTTSVNENSGAGQVVYTATASDTDFNGLEDITFSLADESLGFSIDADTGVVTTNADFAADYENAQSQSFTVVATDATGNSSEQLVSVVVNNLDEVAPTITSDASNTTSVNENSGAGQVVYTATASDADFNGAQDISFSLADDSLGFSIDADTGVVTTNADFAANYEDAQSQSFTVVATDAKGNASAQQLVSVAINNLDEVAPTITSDASNATSINENSGAGQVVYTATASDTDFNGAQDITFSLADETLGFSIDADTGVVTTNTDFAADYEDAQSQSFTIAATDATGNSSEQLVSVAINNLDEVAPSITSGDTAVAIDENSGAGQVVYTATADDSADISGGVTFSLADESLGFSIDADTGVVTTNADFAADYEDAQSQNFTVVATDAAGNVSEAQSVTLDINNLDEVAPTITSADTAAAIDEKSGTDQVIYTATADDSADISAGVTFSLTGDSDSALSIDSLTGAVTLNADADYETQSQYSFTVIADDAVNEAVELSVTLDINNLDEVAPVINSGGTTTAIDENSGAGQVIYTATASDTDFNGAQDITFSLSGTDAGSFTINEDSGEVTLVADPDHETQSQYSFAVVATDAAGNASEQLVSLGINNLDDTAPLITSGDTAVAIDENSGAGQVVYTATADDPFDVTDTPTTDNSSDTDSAVSTVTVPDLVAATQHVYVSSSTKSEDGTQETVVISYNAEDSTTTGLGIRVHFDSSVIDVDDISDTLLTNKIVLGAFGTDDSDHDGDVSTDQHISFAWASPDSSWPGSEGPVDLATIVFDINENATGASAINFTSTSTAAGFSFDGQTHNLALTAVAPEGQTSSVEFSLADESLGFSIDADGVVTTNADFAADYEDAQSQSFTVIATDATGNASEQVVSVAINNLDEVAPVINSGDIATAVDENSGAGQVVYTATADDSLDDVSDTPITFTLAEGSDAALSIDPSTGEVTLSTDPDHETQSEYSFAVIATDAAGNASEAQSVILEINDLDDAAPTITSGSTATAIDENSGAGQVVYTATSTDLDDDEQAVPISFTLAEGSDTALSIDPSTGAVTLSDDPDHEVQSSYSFAVIATDAAGNASAEQSVTLSINDLDDAVPSITSGSTATAIDENSGAGQVVYTATSTDLDDDEQAIPITFTLAEGSDAALSIDSSTGEVTLSDDPDHETQSEYSFAVIATDAAGNASDAQSVILEINDLDDVAPTITSGDAAVAIDENSGSGQVIYTATADDSADDVSDTPITFSLSSDSDVALTIDASTGEVTLVSDPDHETQSEYSFVVIATDAAGNASDAQSVTLSINDLDDAAPTITSASIADTIDENSGSDQVIYTATAYDSLDDVSDTPITFTLAEGSDAALSIDPLTGAVTLSTDPDHETQSEYNFAVIATDGAGNASEAQSVTLSINDLDDAAPTITSSSIADTIDENSGSGQVIYTATADDSGDDVSDTPITFSLSSDSDVALTIDASTGEVTLVSDPDHETQSEYSFAVIATDAAGNASDAQSVTLSINDLDDAAPTITSATIADTIDENSGAEQVVYTATADDSGDDVSDTPITFSLSSDSDVALTIDASTGEVTLVSDPDHETQSSYSFAVIATDAAGNASDAQSVILEINDLDDAAPTITSATIADTIDENSGAEQVVYTATADDSADDVADTPITFSLSSDSDVALSIDSSTGAVTLSTDPDHEIQSSYNFAVIATDAAGNASDAQSVILEINDLDDAAPTITSGDAAVAIDENSGSGQVIYTATADDSGDDVSDTPITFSLSSDSDVALTIDASTGEVTLSTDPDHEAQSSYNFAVVATDAAGNASDAQSVILEINDLDDAAPTITSATIADTIDENSGAEQVVYTATADDQCRRCCRHTNYVQPIF